MSELVIKNCSLRDRLDDKGYAVLRGFSDDQVQLVRAKLYEKICDLLPGVATFNTGCDIQDPIRNKIFDEVEKVLVPLVSEYFANFEVAVALMFLKRPCSTADGCVRVHCDPTLLPDESSQRHINFWMPLVDVDATNGALWMVPHSHVVFPPANAISIPPAFTNIQNELSRYAECVPMRAGELLVFDNRMPHYSMQNLSDSDRPALVLSIVPREAEFISLYRPPEENGQIEVYRQSHDWYRGIDWIAAMKRPSTGEFLGYLNFQPYFLSESELCKCLDARRPIQPYRFQLK